MCFIPRAAAVETLAVSGARGSRPRACVGRSEGATLWGLAADVQEECRAPAARSPLPSLPYKVDETCPISTEGWTRRVTLTKRFPNGFQMAPVRPRKWSYRRGDRGHHVIAGEKRSSCACACARGGPPGQRPRGARGGRRFAGWFRGAPDLDQVLVCFPSAVENRAVARRAQHLLVQRALAALALRPEPREVLLHVVDILKRLAAQRRLRCGAARSAGRDGGTGMNRTPAVASNSHSPNMAGRAGRGAAARTSLGRQ